MVPGSVAAACCVLSSHRNLALIQWLYRPLNSRSVAGSPEDVQHPSRRYHKNGNQVTDWPSGPQKRRLGTCPLFGPLRSLPPTGFSRPQTPSSPCIHPDPDTRTSPGQCRLVRTVECPLSGCGLLGLT